MDFNWLWQGTFSSILAYLIISGVGIVVTILKAKAARFLSPLMYGLAASTLTAMLIIALNVQHKLIVEQKSMTTIENVQEKVRNCIESLHLNMQSSPDDSSYFKYIVTTEAGDKITIARLKGKGNYLILQSSFAPDKEAETLLYQLSNLQREELIHDMMAEAARRLSIIHIDTKQFRNITLEKDVPIVAGLTEYALTDEIGYMDSTTVLVRNAFALALAQVKYKH